MQRFMYVCVCVCVCVCIYLRSRDSYIQAVNVIKQPSAGGERHLLPSWCLWFSIKKATVTSNCLRVCACAGPALWNPMDYRPPGSFVHGILQARIMGLVAISYARGSSESRNWTRVSYLSCTSRQIVNHWATWEAHVSPHTDASKPLKLKHSFLKQNI